MNTFVKISSSNKCFLDVIQFEDVNFTDIYVNSTLSLSSFVGLVPF